MRMPNFSPVAEPYRWLRSHRYDYLQASAPVAADLLGGQAAEMAV